MKGVHPQPAGTIGGEKYQRVRDKLGREPTALIRELRFRNPRPERPDGKPGPWPFRLIAPMISEQVGFYVSYEAVRDWARKHELVLAQRRAERG